jgi:hypothetical protein
MTLASMHPMFQVLINFRDRSLPNHVPKIHIHIEMCLLSRSYSQCWVEIAPVIGIWKCLLECQDWRSTMFLFANCKHCILGHVVFGEAFIVTGTSFAEHIFVKCPPHTKTYFWRPTWHLTVLEDFNIEHRGEPTTTPFVVFIITYTICKGPTQDAYKSQTVTFSNYWDAFIQRHK